MISTVNFFFFLSSSLKHAESCPTDTTPECEIPSELRVAS